MLHTLIDSFAKLFYDIPSFGDCSGPNFYTGSFLKIFIS